VDPAKVTAAVDALLAERPHMAERTGLRPDRSQGTRRNDAGSSGLTFADVLRGAVDPLEKSELALAGHRCTCGGWPALPDPQ